MKNTLKPWPHISVDDLVFSSIKNGRRLRQKNKMCVCHWIQFLYAALVCLDLESPESIWNERAWTGKYYTAMNKHWGKAAISLLQPAKDPRFAFEPLHWCSTWGSHTSSEDPSVLVETLPFLLSKCQCWGFWLLKLISHACQHWRGERTQKLNRKFPWK